MNTVKPIKAITHHGVPRIQPMALTLERLRTAMDAKGKPSSSTRNVVDLLAGKGKARG
jgi:hypothetical protein